MIPASELTEAAEEAMIRYALFNDGRAFNEPLPIPDHQVQFAANLVDRSGIIERVAAWRQEDRVREGLGAGGRPRHVDDRAIVTIFVLLAMEHSPLHLIRAAQVVQSRLSSEARTVLGLPAKGLPGEDWYDRVWRSYTGFIGVVDPMPVGEKYAKSNRRDFLTRMKYDEILAARESLDASRKQERINWVANQLQEITTTMVPRHARRKWEGNACVDATVVSAFGQRRAKEKQDVSDYCSIEIDAGWYGREKDGRDDAPVTHRPKKTGRTTPKKTRSSKKWIYGWEASLVVMAESAGSKAGEYPLLVLGMAFHKPGVEPGGHAVQVVRSILDRGHRLRRLMGDLAYPNSKVEKFQAPLRQLGIDLTFDYRKDQLGHRGGYEGAIFVEGWFYCPSMPQNLIDATEDHRAGLIDDDTYRDLIARRRRYAFRVHEHADADGYIRLVCPAGGAAPTASCGIKGSDGTTLIHVVPERPGKACTQQTLTFPLTTYAKFGQDLQYGSRVWHETYSRARNTIEGFNGFVKDGSYEALGEASRRRVRGYTSQFFMCALLVMVANLRKIADWLRVQDEEAGLRPRRKGRRKSGYRSVLVGSTDTVDVSEAAVELNLRT